MAHIQAVLEALERAFPLPLQEDYDNAGLQIGLRRDGETAGALLCLDVTEQALDECIRRGWHLLISHHPLIFRPVKRISPETPQGRCILKAVQHGITVYSAHTNLDNAPEGLNFHLARLLGLEDVAFLSPFERGGFSGGSGAVGTLREPMALDAFLDVVRRELSAECVRWMGPAPQGSSLVRKVALCGGAGDFLLDDAVRAGADVFLTGEAHYHQMLDFSDRLHVVAAGHYETEHRAALDALAATLATVGATYGYHISPRWGLGK